MNPPKINTTGNTEVDTLTAELAVIFRDSGCTEQDAIHQAQQLRNRWIMAVMPVAQYAQGAIQAAQGDSQGGHECKCTGWDGCPSPTACGTPQGCHCGA